MDSHYLQSNLKLKRLEFLEKYRTLLSNREYAYIYDRKDTIKREIFKFLEEVNIKYNASIDEIENIIKEIKTNNFKNTEPGEEKGKEVRKERENELLKKILDSI